MNKSKFIEINGVKVQLIEKQCDGGCGSTFWGLSSAKNICQNCLAKTPEQRAQTSQRIQERNALNKLEKKPIFGSDTPSIKAVKDDAVYVPIQKKETLTLDLGDGCILYDLNKADYSFLNYFVKANKPIDLECLLKAHYGHKLKDTSFEVLKEKRSSIITKISRLRFLLERTFGGSWLHQKKGYWQLKGIPVVENFSNIVAIDDLHKLIKTSEDNGVSSSLNTIAKILVDKVQQQQQQHEIPKDVIPHTAEDSPTTVEDIQDIPDLQDKTVEDIQNIPDSQDKTVDDIQNIPDSQDKTVDDIQDIPDSQDKTVDDIQDIPDLQDKTVDDIQNIPDSQDKTVDDIQNIPKDVLISKNLYSLDFGDGRVIKSLVGHDYFLLKCFVNDNKPLNLNDLFALFYDISIDKQLDYTIDSLITKRSSLLKRLGKIRNLLKNTFGGDWLLHNKGHWQLFGISKIEKPSNLYGLTALRKSIDAAKPDVTVVEKALDILDIKKTATPSDCDDRWINCIERAKHIKDMVKNNRLLIADLAIEACDIVHGGGAHWTNFSKQRTVTNFSNAIGLNTKTLYEWIKVKTYVVNKLPSDTDYSNPKLWTILRTVQEKVEKDTEAAQVKSIYNFEINRRGIHAKIKHVIKTTKHVRNFLKKNTLEDLHSDDLLELQTTCKEISASLNI